MNIETHHLSQVEEFLARHQSGLMTLVFTDLEGSTDLKKEIGDIRAGVILTKHHEYVRELLKSIRGAKEVDRPGDSFFIVFDSPSNAVTFAVRLHQKMRELSQEADRTIRNRVGIHVGEVFFERDAADGQPKNFVSIQVDTCARVMSLCEPGRTLLTRAAFDNAQQTLRGRGGDLGNLQWSSHGLFKLKGVDQPLEICEVLEAGKPPPTSLGNTAKAERYFSATSISAESELERAPGWRGIVARRWREVAISIGVAWVLVFITILSPYLINRLEAVSYDLAYFFQPNALPPQEAVIVFMDEKSHHELKQPDNAPWDHAIHARLVERLTKANARAIAFDVLFTDPQPSSPVFIKACEDSGGRVTLAALQQGTKWEKQMIRPFDQLLKVAPYGAVEVFDERAKARQLYGVQGSKAIPTLAELVAKQMNSDAVRPAGGWLNYYGPGAIPNVSYVQALTNDVPDKFFSGKAVFIGAAPLVGYTGGRGTNDYVRMYDEFQTPFGKMAGVELNATASLNLMRGETLRQISPIAQLAIFLGSALFVAVAISFLRTGWAVFAGAALILAVASLNGWMVWTTHQWFSWAIVSFVEIPAILLCNVVTRTERLTRQKKALEETLVAQQSEFITKASLFQNQAGAPQGSKPLIPDHELFTQIGKGAYGEVWLARNLTKSFRAIKIVKARHSGSGKPSEREFEGLKRFEPISREHPGLVAVLQVGKNDEGGYFFYIMEAADDIVSGRNIDPATYRPKTLSSRLEGNQALATKDFFEMAISLCEGLHFLHGKGLLHRDLKPANVLYVAGRPQLADPGLVTGASGEEVSMLGTIGYMAPENAASVASDIYSLGKVMYQAAFGRPVAAFPELPTFLLHSENQAYYMGLNEIILKACAESPRERHISAAELRSELEDLGLRLGVLKSHTPTKKI